jgi:antitoxin HicB
MLRYPVTLKRDTNGTIRVEFRDVPEANTFGEDADEALIEAVDALESALSLYIEDRGDVSRNERAALSAYYDGMELRPHD